MKLLIHILVVIAVIGGGIMTVRHLTAPDRPDREQAAHTDSTVTKEVGGEEENNREAGSVEEPGDNKEATLPETANVVSKTSGKYTGDYTIDDSSFGTKVTVRIANGIRTIVSNALPNHATGDFPNQGNPNTISAQNNTYQYPLTPTWTGNAVWAREPGVAINGVKFEPETAERTTCQSGEVYKIEAIQEVADLGLDFNNAHVQPTGAYHYHGSASQWVDVFDDGNNDLVHVGFAADGYLVYYSRSGVYEPSYRLSQQLRVGSSCTLNAGRNSWSVDIQDSQPDGIYVSDWEYVSGTGDLDECNGTVIDGTYAYLITDEYPYIGRCLNGVFTETRPGGGEEPGQSGPSTSNTGGDRSGPPSGGPPQAAIDACRDKSQGSSCTVSGGPSGTCMTPPGQSDLACVPAR